MKLYSAAVLAAVCVDAAFAFVSPQPQTNSLRAAQLFSSLKEGPTKEDTSAEDPSISATSETPSIDPDAEGLPWWWELVWKLDVMKKGEPGEEVIFGDSANVLRTNIEQIYGGVSNREA